MGMMMRELLWRLLGKGDCWCEGGVWMSVVEKRRHKREEPDSVNKKRRRNMYRTIFHC